MKNKINVVISEETLSIDTVYQDVLDESCGGICLFVGTVRNKNKGKNVTHLDFETYTPMALKEMNKIGQRAVDQYDIQHISIFHRNAIQSV